MPASVRRVTLASPITTLKGVGEKIAALCAEIEIYTIEDLLWYLPTQYEDRTNHSAIASITTPGLYTIRCTVTQARARKTRRRASVVEALVTDDSGSIRCTWFNQPYISAKIQSGAEIFLSGKVTLRGSMPIFINPYVDAIDTQQLAGKIVPIYPLHSTLKQHTLRSMIAQALACISQLSEDTSQETARQFQLSSLRSAILTVHRPASHTELVAAQQRIALSRLLEWFSVMLSSDTTTQHRAPACTLPLDDLKRYLTTLPFTLTVDQKKSLWAILQNLNSDIPMMRILCGEVGSGKTIVTALASLAVLRSGHQVVCMAPTDILAQQHFSSFTQALRASGYTVILHTSQHPASSAELRTADLIVGTHALLSRTVDFRSLGLVVVDEQHRFGVMQRHQLLNQTGRVPHFLSLTATPIPRTLALSLFGKLSISTIRTMPEGRTLVVTRVISAAQRTEIYTTINDAIRRAEGVFVVCPLIDPSDVLSIASVEHAFHEYSAKLPQARIAMLHGKLKKEEQQQIMTDFRAQRIDCVIATTVIEVGVDIPHATLMVIEDADRFGLATLHQLRGRVGRSDKPSTCIVTTTRKDARAQERLQFFARTHSGFELARYDIQLRGAGDILGIEQSGASEIVSIALQHPHLVEQAHTIATYMQTHTKQSQLSVVHLE